MSFNVFLLVSIYKLKYHLWLGCVECVCALRPAKVSNAMNMEKL